MRNVSVKSCTQNQNARFILNTFYFRKSCRLCDNVEKYGTARQTADDSKIRSMHYACWITKATDTHSEYAILLQHGNNGYANAPQCYVCSAFSLLLSVTLPGIISPEIISVETGHISRSSALLAGEERHTMHLAPNQSLKHAARQFGLYDPPTDFIQITECGPDKHFFFISTLFTSHPLRVKKVCNIWLVT